MVKFMKDYRQILWHISGEIFGRFQMWKEIFLSVIINIDDWSEIIHRIQGGTFWTHCLIIYNNIDYENLYWSDRLNGLYSRINSRALTYGAIWEDFDTRNHKTRG